MSIRKSYIQQRSPVGRDNLLEDRNSKAEYYPGIEDDFCSYTNFTIFLKIVHIEAFLLFYSFIEDLFGLRTSSSIRSANTNAQNY